MNSFVDVLSLPYAFNIIFMEIVVPSRRTKNIFIVELVYDSFLIQAFLQSIAFQSLGKYRNSQCLPSLSIHFLSSVRFLEKF